MRTLAEEVPLADDAAPPTPEELDALTAASDAGGEPPRERQRDRLTIKETAHAFGISVEEARRWARGKSLPRRNPPWEPNSDPNEPPYPILRLSPRKQYLLVDRLDLSRIHPHVREKIDFLLRFREGEVEVD